MFLPQAAFNKKQAIEKEKLQTKDIFTKFDYQNEDV
jgi:hypothetical protein